MKSVHSEPAPDGTGSSPISPDPSSFTFVDPQMTAFLGALRKLVLAETAAQRQQIHAHWRKPLPARIAEGYAIANPRLVDVRPNGQAVLACTRNDARFRPGDILRLSRNDPFAPDGLMVNLDDEEADQLIISAELPVNWRQLFAQGDDWTLDVGWLDLSSFVLGALAEAGDTLVGRGRILPLLMGRLQPTIDPALYAEGLQMGEALGLNWSQSEALANAYATDLAYLVQGPPGTGKTFVLATLARALVNNGERVLICSFTHRAINNALNTLVRHHPDIPIVKIGQATQADDLLVENYESFHGSPLVDEAGGYVIGATPFATRTRRLADVEFDTVIFDEASQMTLPLAIMGMLAGQKYVFFGDQRQLPPVLTTRYTGGALRDSVFGYLAGGNFDTMLTETYRLNAALAQWPSRQFYDGRLQPAPEVAQRQIIYPNPPARWMDVLDPDEPAVFWDLAHKNNTVFSRREAYAVVDLITALLGCGFPAAEIGVVAPYRAQGRLIRSLLRQYVPETAVHREIVTDTVERMQGQERDLIIVSLTTSNPGFASTVAEFFFQPERLNVAITRARSKLIVVGSERVLDAQPMQPELRETVQLLANLLQRCTRVTTRHALSAQAWESEW